MLSALFTTSLAITQTMYVLYYKDKKIRMICLVCLSFLYTFEFQMACKCKISYNVVWFSIDKKTRKYESFVCLWYPDTYLRKTYSWKQYIQIMTKKFWDKRHDKRKSDTRKRGKQCWKKGDDTAALGGRLFMSLKW